ncbi:hypothetical protein BKA62DRAFT_429033 [Auriculariales sp. MPI-PUGE-AT-0066]|nr:hypothetical protein BKA62DRAFT_429033 [Auriculariales sp. MPI-PUGE-AT-0066]
MPLSDLPLELAQVVFQHAASAAVGSRPGRVVELMTVSSQIYDWTRPVLMHTIIIDKNNQDSFFGMLAAHDQEFFQCVQRLAMLWALPPPNLQQHVLKCLSHVKAATLHRRFVRFFAQSPEFAPVDLIWASDPPDMDDLSPDAGLQTAFHKVQRLRVSSTEVPHTDWKRVQALAPQLEAICLVTPHSVASGRLASFMTYLSTILCIPTVRRVVLRLDVRSTVVWRGLIAVLRDLLREEQRIWVARVTKAELEGGVLMAARRARAGIDPWAGTPLHSTAENTAPVFTGAQRERLRQLKVPHWQ